MKTVFIDVREPHEFAKGHVEGAINLPPEELLQGSLKLKEYAKDDNLILYCVSGARSRTSINILRSQGFTNLTNGINKDYIEAHFQ